VIVGRFTNGANVFVEGKMGVKNDNESEQPATTT